MNKKALALSFALFLFLSCMNASAQVEQVISYTVTDEDLLVESLDAWFASDDSDYGQTSALVTVVANGSDPSTHHLVINYPDFAAYQAAIEGVGKSDEFAKLERRISGIMTSTGESVYVHATDNGEPWKAGYYQYIVPVDVSGKGSVYIAAFNGLMNSEIGKKAPGEFKLVENRAGGDSDYLVILSAPSLAALNKYLDSYTDDNKDWQDFLSKVEGISAAMGTNFLRIVKVWK